MKETTCYVTVRLNVVYDEAKYKNGDEAVQEAVSECLYEFVIDRPDLRIMDTEICGINE